MNAHWRITDTLHTDPNNRSGADLRSGAADLLVALGRFSSLSCLLKWRCSIDTAQGYPIANCKHTKEISDLHFDPKRYINFAGVDVAELVFTLGNIICHLFSFDLTTHSKTGSGR